MSELPRRARTRTWCGRGRRCERLAVALGFSLVDQTKVVTAASELARQHDPSTAAAATLQVERLNVTGSRRGLRLTFARPGPGIPDVELALRDGYTTGHRPGPGTGGARRRLMSELSISSRPG